MIEVELKYRLDDPESLLSALIARGAEPGAATIERDVYFNHPSRDFAETDEALRLRWDGSVDTSLDLESLEKRHIARVLKLTAGNKSEAAKVLGIDRKTLQRKGF